MAYYPFNTNAVGRNAQTDVDGVSTSRGFVVKHTIAAAAATVASTTGIHAAVTDDGTEQTITTSITQPSVPRGISATSGGTAGDIGAIQVTINGTDYNDAVLQEVLPIFTANSATTVQGSKAFKTVTSIVIPAHDGLGATTAIGFNEKLGLPDKLAANTVLLAVFDGTREATAPTVVASSSAISGNTVDLNTALNSKQVDIWYIV